MGTIDAKTLGQRIREARIRAGLPQEALGQAVGLERTAINKIESGTRRVTALELSDIAEAVATRLSTFFEETAPALVSHRSSQGLDTADSKIDALLAALVHDVHFVTSLDGRSSIPNLIQRSALPNFEAPRNNDAADEMATQVRQLLGLENGEPVTGLVGKVGSLGLFAFSRDIGPDTADAGTVLLDRFGVTLVNSFMKVGRRRLALAHELGHYLIGDEYTIDWRVVAPHDDVPLESRLDRFARSLLLPKVALGRFWPDKYEALGERRAAVWLASTFRVDMSTLARRLTELGLIGSDSASEIRDYRPNKSDFVEMGLNNPPEEMEGTAVSPTFAQSVLYLLRSEKIGRARALELLQGTFEETDLPPARARPAQDIWKFVS